MSKENAIKFMEDVSKDSGLMGQLKKRVENLKDSKDEDSKAKETCKFAKEKGYDFSLEELKDVVAKGTTSGELSDEMLENVAGGGFWSDLVDCVKGVDGLIKTTNELKDLLSKL